MTRSPCFYCFAVFSSTTSLGRALAHCPRFLTAASNRSQGLVSVPMWLNNLSVQLSMIGLVRYYSHQLPNTTQPPQAAIYIPLWLNSRLQNISNCLASDLRILHQCATITHIISRFNNRLLCHLCDCVTCMCYACW